MMYYFCNDYIIEPNSHIRRRSKNIKPLKDDFFSVPMPNDNTENMEVLGNSPTVNVSAIVGMNGDGKSTLVEFSSENLRRVKNVKAELYYMLDNVVYRMAEEEEQQETIIWKIAELNKDLGSGEMMRWEIKQNGIAAKDISNCFFFTIVSNYSHYAYNVYDYEKEWNSRGNEKDVDEKCWLYYVFHKNDGYLTPITLHPFRNKGNIDINNEKNLSKQRLLSLFLNAENPSVIPNSFRRVNGKDANVLKLIETSESKLQQKTILDFFEDKKQDNRFKNLLDKIDKIEDEIIQATILDDSDSDHINSYIDDYQNLIETIIPVNFTNPINIIIEQDDGFYGFANQVVNWLNTNANNKSTPDNGDIATVVRNHEKLSSQYNEYFEIGKIIQVAKEYKSKGTYKKALNHYLNAMVRSENGLGKKHVFTALIYNDLAVTYECLTKFDNALRYYNKALKIKISKLRSEHPSIATTYNNIGAVYNKKGDYGKALEYYFKASEIREKVLGPDHLDTVATYNNIGLVYKSQGGYSKALEYFFKALVIVEKVLGTEHLYTATSYNNIGTVYDNQGNYSKALVYLGKALVIKENVLGSDHPDTATNYNNIGLVYDAQGDYLKALEYLFKALAIQEKVLGPDHPDNATS